MKPTKQWFIEQPIRPDHYWTEWWNDDAGKWIPVTLFKSPYALFSED